MATMPTSPKTNCWSAPAHKAWRIRAAGLSSDLLELRVGRIGSDDLAMRQDMARYRLFGLLTRKALRQVQRLHAQGVDDEMIVVQAQVVERRARAVITVLSFGAIAVAVWPAVP